VEAWKQTRLQSVLAFLGHACVFVCLMSVIPCCAPSPADTCQKRLVAKLSSCCMQSTPCVVDNRTQLTTTHSITSYHVPSKICFQTYSMQHAVNSCVTVNRTQLTTTHLTHLLLQASGKWVVLMDADLSHHPRYISRFLERQVRQTSLLFRRVDRIA
jgi:hypothetical protein